MCAGSSGADIRSGSHRAGPAGRLPSLPGWSQFRAPRPCAPPAPCPGLTPWRGVGGMWDGARDNPPPPEVLCDREFDARTRARCREGGLPAPGPGSSKGAAAVAVRVNVRCARLWFESAGARPSDIVALLLLLLLLLEVVDPFAEAVAGPAVDEGVADGAEAPPLVREAAAPKDWLFRRRCGPATGGGAVDDATATSAAPPLLPPTRAPPALSCCPAAARGAPCPPGLL